MFSRLDVIKDLGVVLYEPLCIDRHFEDTIGRANRVLGLVLRMFREVKNLECIQMFGPYWSYVFIMWVPFFIKHQIEPPPSRTIGSS